MLPQGKHLRCYNKISWAKQSAHRRWQQHHGVITHFYSPKRLITLVPSSSPILAQPPQNSQVLMSMMYLFYYLTIYIYIYIHTVDFLSKETSPLWSLPKKTPSIHPRESLASIDQDLGFAHPQQTLTSTFRSSLAAG